MLSSLTTPRSALNLSEKDHQTSRLNHQLYRYSHEPISSNFLRRDIPPILILLFFLFLIVITLSQILVVHTSRYGTNFSAMQKLQEELKLMDESMEVLLRDNVLPIDKWRLLFHIQSYLTRFEYLFHLFNEMINQTQIERLLTKSNEVLSKGNLTEHWRTNLQHVQNRLKNIINRTEDIQLNNSMRNFCREEPAFLRRFLFNHFNHHLLFLEGRMLDGNSTFPNISLYDIERNYSHVRSGGQWSPSHCIARHRVNENEEVFSKNIYTFI